MNFDDQYGLSIQDPELYMSLTEEQRARFDQWYKKRNIAAAKKQWSESKSSDLYFYALFVHLSALVIGYETHSDQSSNFFLKFLINCVSCVLVSVGFILCAGVAGLTWLILDRGFLTKDCYSDLQPIKHEKLRTVASYIVATLCAGCIATLLNFYGNW